MCNELTPAEAIRVEAFGLDRPKPLSDHSLSVTINSEHGESISLSCHADFGSDCVVWCAEGCEDGTEDREDHKLVPVPCMKIEWWMWDSASSLEGYTGPEAELHSGPIVITECGEDGVFWHYAESAVSL